MRTLVLPQRVQVHTVFCSSLSQLLCHWCLRTRQISPGFMASDLLRKQRYLGGHPNVTEYEEGPFSVIEASPTVDFKRSREDVAQVRASPQGRWWTAPLRARAAAYEASFAASLLAEALACCRD